MLIRKLVNGTIQRVISPQSNPIVGATRYGNEWMLTFASSVKKLDQSGTLTPVLTGNDNIGIVTYPVYSAFQYGAQGATLIGIKRHGDYVFQKSNNFYTMSRLYGTFSMLLNYSLYQIDSAIIDHSTDDIYFVEKINSLQIIKRYISIENRVEMFAGSLGECHDFQPNSNSSELCFSAIVSMNIRNNSLFFLEQSMFRVLKIDISTRLVNSIMGSGCERFKCISGLGGKLEGTEFTVASVRLVETETREIYGSSGKVIFKLSSFSPNATLEHVIGVVDGSLTIKSALAFHPVTKKLFYLMTGDVGDSGQGMFTLENGTEIFVGNVSSDFSAYNSMTISSKNKAYVGGNSNIYEYDLSTGIYSKFITDSNFVGLCLSTNELYLVFVTLAYVKIYEFSTKTTQMYAKPTGVTLFSGVYCHSNGNVYVSGYDGGSSMLLKKFDISTKAFSSLTSVPVYDMRSSFIVKSDNEFYYAGRNIYHIVGKSTVKIGGGYSGCDVDKVTINPSFISMSKEGEIYFDLEETYTYLWKAGRDGVVRILVGNGTMSSLMGWQNLNFPTYMSPVSNQGDFIFIPMNQFTPNGIDPPYTGKSLTIEGSSNIPYFTPVPTYGPYYTSIDDDFYGKNGGYVRFLYDCGERDKYGHCSKYCYGIKSLNGTVCSGNGDCMDTDSCDCNDGYFGDECEYFSCYGISSHEVSLVCNGHGDCLSFDNCYCTSNYTGLDCSRLHFNQSSVDQLNHTDTFNNSLTNSTTTTLNETNVQDNFTSLSNQTTPFSNTSSLANETSPISNETVSNSTNNQTLNNCNVTCSLRGYCVNSSCVCQDGYSGLQCEMYSCNNITFSSCLVCSGKGSCDSLNNCTCREGHFGRFCELSNQTLSNTTTANETLFNNVTSTNETVFNNFTSTNETLFNNVTSANETVFNNFTSTNETLFKNSTSANETSINNSTSVHIVSCFGFPNTSSLACSGNGYCNSDDHCVCKDGYSGNQCQDFSCYGKRANSACSGVGKCIGLDNCSCPANRTGLECELSVCFGFPSNNSNVCSGRGSCIGPNKCSCQTADYGGDNCQYTYCFGKLALNVNVCNGLGDCVGVNDCTCKAGYFGDECQFFTCGSIPSNQSSVCSGHGSCIGLNMCDCKQNKEEGYWQGSDCQSCFPNYENEQSGCKSPTCDPLLTCSNHGSCSSDLKCICSAYWDGVYCDRCKPNYFGPNCSQLCQKNSTCSNHGVCSSDGSCSCYSDIQNGFWTGTGCSKCQSGFYGNECSTHIEGPAKFLNMFNGISFKLFGPSSYSSNYLNCSKLVSDMNLIGSNPTCMWTNRTTGEFTILFGNDFSLVPNSIISLNRLVFDSVKSISNTNFETIPVLNADSPSTPEIILSYSKQVSMCESIVIDASNSYSGDRKPLKFYWTVVSSPNNILSSSQFNQYHESTLSISPQISAAEGLYKFTLQVESSISGMRSGISEISITKSSVPVPKVSIVGFSEISVTNLRSPLIVKKVINLPDCYYSNQSLSIRWVQVSGNHLELSTDSYNNLVINSFSIIGEASYDINVIVTSNVNPQSTSFATVRINTKPSPLSFTLYKTNVAMNGVSLEVDLSDPEQSTEVETWKWSCLDLTSSTSCGHSIDDQLLAYSNNRSKSIVIPSVDYVSSPPPTLRITLQITKGTRNVQTRTEINFPESEHKIPPTISLISVSPPKTEFLKQDIISIQLAVSPVSGIEREWSINNQVLDSSNPIVNRMSIPPSSSNSLVLDASKLEEGRNYILSFRVNSQNGLSASYSFSFSIAISPQSCPCSIEPSSGIALETEFTFSCTNCQNSKKSLQITYGFIDDKSGANIPLYLNGELFSTKLPCSYTPLTNKIVQTFIKIIDTSNGAYYESRRDITIDLPSAKSVIEVKKKANAWSTYEKSLRDGNTDKMVFNSATISRTFEGMMKKIGSSRQSTQQSDCVHGSINPKTLTCICNPGFTKKDCSMNETLLTEVKEFRISQMNKFIQTFESRNKLEEITDYYFTLQTYGLDSLIENYDEMDDYSMDKSYEIISTLFTLVEKNDNLKVPRGVEVLTTSILNSIYKYLRFKNFVGQYEKLKEFVGMIKYLGNFMLRSLHVGEYDLNLETEFAYLISNKLLKDDFSLRLLAPNTNYSIQLPSEMPNFIDETNTNKPISFITLSNIDFFSANESLSAPIISTEQKLAENNQIKITKQQFIRSNLMSHFYLVDYPLKNAANSLVYHFELENVIPIGYNIEKIKSSTSDKTSITTTYEKSEFICVDFSNYNVGNSSNCIVTVTELSRSASCSCDQEGIFMVAEEITQIIRKEPFEDNSLIAFGLNVLAIVLGTILPILVCSLCCCCIVVIFCLCSRRRRKNDKNDKDNKKEIELEFGV